ncbi:MAG: hypothetical protein JJLCMIEE_00158 [Acidimicrobiales bacterium]|nr:hypothetical protein [Acidimicrobiales bacterium]
MWIDEGPVREEAHDAVQRGRSPQRRVRRGIVIDLDELRSLVGAKRAGPVGSQLNQAATAFERERYDEARTILARLVKEVPASATIRELYGLTLYRLGRWRAAARQLEAFGELTGGSTEQHPVLADCRRALGNWDEVERLWDELRRASPGAEVVNEGRIVAAGAKADQGRVADAIRLLEKGWRFPKKPRVHHLRRAYSLADLYERAGDTPRARALFSQIARSDPQFADASARATLLGQT